MSGEPVQDVSDRAQNEKGEPAHVGYGDPRAASKVTPLQAAERLYQQRRNRSKYFDVDLFGEACWDILLDLFIQHERGKPVNVSSACIGACVPTSTALRWLGDLERRGLAVRTHDARDGRRTHIALTKAAVDQMTAFLICC